MNILRKIGRAIKKTKDLFFTWFEDFFGKFTGFAGLTITIMAIAFLSIDIGIALLYWTVVIGIYIVIFRTLWSVTEPDSLRNNSVTV